MCFYISPTSPNSFIAEKDLTCYKIVKAKENKLYFESFYEKFKYWSFNKLIPCKKVTIEIEDGVIFKGYHSYYDFTPGIDHPSVTFPNLAVEFVIPKGTKYFVNPQTKEYVSECIRLKKFIKGNELKKRYKNLDYYKEFIKESDKLKKNINHG